MNYFSLTLRKTFKMSLKKMRWKKFTSLNASQVVDNLLCNLRRRTWIASSITFMKMVYCCVLKYWSPLDVIATFLIKTITHRPPLYVLRSCSYSVLKLLPKVRISWSNSLSPSVINNYFSPLLFPPPFTSTMMIAIIA